MSRSRRNIKIPDPLPPCALQRILLALRLHVARQENRQLRRELGYYRLAYAIRTLTGKTL